MKLALKFAIGTAALLIAWQLIRGLRTVKFEYDNFHIPRTQPARPADAAARGMRDVEFLGADRMQLRGWYFPSTSGAAVVVAAGSTADRTTMLDHARAIHDGGTGVLVFDWPGCGLSDGAIGLGPNERGALKAAINFLAAQDDVRDGRIGVVGFSLGGYAAMHVGATDPRVKAFVLEGVFDEPWSQTRAEYRNSGRVVTWAALLGHYLGGLEREAPSAKAIIAKLSPRPTLFVSGANDTAVPESITRELFDNAREPKQMWTIAGAGHGGYMQADTTYGKRLREFIERALAPAAHDSAVPCDTGCQESGGRAPSSASKAASDPD